MKVLIQNLGRLILFVLLTIITQIGGLIYLIGIVLSNRIKFAFWGKKLVVFIVLYVTASFLIVPIVAPWFGREKIRNNDNLQAASFATVLLNRNYVTPETHEFLQNISRNLAEKKPEVKARYLDACFPFFDGFPLLPHLSHNDGCKVDFSLVYEDINGQIVNKSKSISGYGVFENPLRNEVDQCKDCLQKGYFQYDYPKYLIFGRINDDLKFSKSGTNALIEAILSQRKLTKMFIEPHLEQRLKLEDKRVRFHGCRSVRHDDHIHVQIN
ncbi:hypothetical protein [Marinifilum flexuosum]|uniref:Uncharacterized protein n=1 Tax=Marinifilum flexuosum TaxID=1117708 RepID=A0A419X443_9BACT|nr:hypothetical protein [Marinifilum flexuosum]RKE02487.1 hypothetical protein BXY64_2577 [Marinifilum flexuosum]